MCLVWRFSNAFIVSCFCGWLQGRSYHDFLTAVSMAGCKSVASKDFCTFFIFFCSMLGFRGSLEWPLGPLVITSAPGPLKKSILAAFGNPAGIPWGTRLGPFSGSGLPREFHGEPLEAIC